MADAPPPPVSFAHALHAIIRTHAATRHTLAAATPTVEVAGHSLGSALATLYCVDRHTGADNFPAARLCTFASPMVGDQAFQTAFATTFLHGDPDRSWRFYISSDIVHFVPPSILGFVPIDNGIELKLSWEVRWWWAPCAHALASYRHILNPKVPLPTECGAATVV